MKHINCLKFSGYYMYHHIQHSEAALYPASIL